MGEFVACICVYKFRHIHYDGHFYAQSSERTKINKHNCTSKRETYLSRSAKFYYYATLLFFEMRVRSDGRAYAVPDYSAGSLCCE